MKIITFFTLAIVTVGLAVVPVTAAEEDKPPLDTLESLSTVFPPYLQNPAADAMTVCFLAQAADHVRVAWGGSAEALTETAATPLVIPGTPWVMWKTRLTGLIPDGTYTYQVRCHLRFKRQDLETPLYHFTTLDPQADTFRFAAFNDIHQQDKTLAALMDHVKTEDYEVAFLLGDCLEASQRTGEASLFKAWRAYLDLLNGSEKPVIFVRGNHDVRQLFASRLAYLFDLPNLSVEQAWGADQWQFTMRAGPVWFLGMDTGEDEDGINSDPRTAYKHPAYWETYRQREATWLKQVLNGKDGADAPWRVFMSHIPLYNNNRWSCVSGRKLWEPLLRTTRIDLMLAGHDHQWKYIEKDKDRVAPVLIGGGPSMKEGTVMLGTASPTSLTVRVMNTSGGVLRTLDFGK